MPTTFPGGQRYVTVLFMMHKSASSSPSFSMSASVITRSGCELHANVLSFSQPNICFLGIMFFTLHFFLTHTYIFFLCFPQTFPASQILVVDGDRLVYDPFPEVRRVEDFLGLEHEITQDHFVFNATKGFYCIKSPGSGDDKCLNETKGRRHPKVPPAVIHTLRKFYAPYNHQFYTIVGKDYNWPED